MTTAFSPTVPVSRPRDPRADPSEWQRAMAATAGAELDQATKDAIWLKIYLAQRRLAWAMIAPHLRHGMMGFQLSALRREGALVERRLEIAVDDWFWRIVKGFEITLSWELAKDPNSPAARALLGGSGLHPRQTL